MKFWTHPNNYCGALWPATYVFLSRHRDSDVLTNSNFECALKKLESLPAFESEEDEKTSRIVVRENHWAVGWVEWIAIHQEDLEAVKAAEEMESALDDYPILDEMDFSEREMEEDNQCWTNCFSDKERIEYIRKNKNQFDFRDFADMLGCARGKYYGGESGLASN